MAPLLGSGGLKPMQPARLLAAGCSCSLTVPQAFQTQLRPHVFRSAWKPQPLAIWRLSKPPGHSRRRYAQTVTVRAAKQKNQEESIYKDTVNLPQTKFNMRANSVQREPELQSWWAKQGIYEALRDGNPGGRFTLHDGPPYANGDLHMGHALNKVLKDVIVKYQLLQGKKVKYVPGWDCHGLPIELKVLQSMSEEQRNGLTPIKLRRKARDFALKTVASQRDQFKRYCFDCYYNKFGVWGEWEAPYTTLAPAYEAAQLQVFGRMFLNGHIYRGRKPVHWSPSTQTALAEAELEYPEGHTSRSIYVAMPIESLGPQVPVELQTALTGASLAIWTTTPWTIPANLAVAVNDQLKYTLVELQDGSHRRLVVAQELADTLATKLEVPLQRLGSFSGAALEGCRYRHPLYDRVSPVVVGGDYITAESGTGLVHTAPGHGQEDYQVGLKYGLPLLSPVDDAGRFTEEAGPSFVGLPVLDEGNEAVIQALTKSGVLLKEEKYAHSYAYDWRSKQPTIFRATDQWFASVDGFREAALAAIDTVQWLPAAGKKRITSMTQGRNDWCISRQRKWGVPIPVFYYTDSGEPLMTEETINHATAIIAEKGSDAWFQMPVEDLLPDSLKAEAPRLKKGEDTMDVWFDSGSSWAGVLGADEALNLPADLYLEGSDQHRGWFQSSLLTSVAAQGQAPYKAVLTHGFVLDERGYKMSKSLGNVVDPRAVMLGGKDQKKEPPYGADVLRLWVASVDYMGGDVSIGPQILNQTSDVYRKLRFTLRYLLGNIHDFNPATDAVPYDQLPTTDRYILSRFAAVLDDISDAYSTYQFFRFFQAVQRFAVLDLSNFYLDVAKDRLYVRGVASADRRACQTVLAALLEGLLAAVAPVLPHMAEDAWQTLPYPSPHASVFQAGWKEPAAEWQSFPEADQATVQSLLAIRSEVNQVLEKARTGKFLGASLEAKVLLHIADEGLQTRLRQLDASSNGADPLRYMLITSQAELVDSAGMAAAADYTSAVELEGVGKVTVGVTRAEGRKCTRCWNYSMEVGADPAHPELCERCLPVIVQSGFVMPEKVAAAV